RGLQLRQTLLFSNLHRMQLDARYLRNVVGVVSEHHEVVPSLCRKAAAGHARHRREVVIADPYAGNVLACDAHEPGITKVRTGARLADGVGEVKLRRSAGPSGDHALQHGVKHLNRLAAEQLLAWWRVTLVRIKELTLQRIHLFDRVVVDFQSATGEHRVVGGVLERRESLVAERKRAGLFETGDAELIHGLKHLVAPDVERDLDGNGIDRVSQGVFEHHSVRLAGGKVLGSPAAARGAVPAHNRGWFVLSGLERG